MSGERWAHTLTTIPTRDGSLTTGCDDELMQGALGQEIAPIDVKELWGNLECSVTRRNRETVLSDEAVAEERREKRVTRQLAPD